MLKILMFLFGLYVLPALSDDRFDVNSFVALNEFIGDLERSGFIFKGVEVNYKIIDFDSGSKKPLVASSFLDLGNRRCQLKLGLNKYAHLGSLGSNDVVDRRGFEYLKTRFVLLHEVSHCRFYALDNVFYGSEYSALLNKYFLFSYDDVSGGGAYYLLQEGFADALAILMLLRKESKNRDLLVFLEGMKRFRSGEGGIHNTSWIFERIMGDRGLSDYVGGNVGDMESFALLVANENLNRMLVKGKNVFLSSDFVVGGVYFTLESMLLEPFYNNSNARVIVNHDLSALREIAQRVRGNLLISESRSFSSESDVLRFLYVNRNKIKQLIAREVANLKA